MWQALASHRSGCAVRLARACAALQLFEVGERSRQLTDLLLMGSLQVKRTAVTPRQAASPRCHAQSAPGTVQLPSAAPAHSGGSSMLVDALRASPHRHTRLCGRSLRQRACSRLSWLSLT